MIHMCEQYRPDGYTDSRNMHGSVSLLLASYIITAGCSHSFYMERSSTDSSLIKTRINHSSIFIRIMFCTYLSVWHYLCYCTGLFAIVIELYRIILIPFRLIMSHIYCFLWSVRVELRICERWGGTINSFVAQPRDDSFLKVGGRMKQCRFKEIYGTFSPLTPLITDC